MMQKNLHAVQLPSPRESVITIGQILLWQTIAGLAFSLTVFLSLGQAAGSSALIGSLVCVIPNVIFALRIVPGFFQDSARQSMNGFYTAEFLKIAVTVLLFLLVFKLLSPLRPDMLFVSFLVTQFSIIFAAMVAR